MTFRVGVKLFWGYAPIEGVAPESSNAMTVGHSRDRTSDGEAGTFKL